MIVDASPLVAILRAEPGHERIVAALARAANPLMSSVTFTECALAALKHGRAVQDADVLLARFGIAVVPVEESLARAAALARHRFPIRFGDAFVLALAHQRNEPILTLDAEFAKTDAALVPLA